MMLATTALMMLLSLCVDVFWVSLCGRKKKEQDSSKEDTTMTCYVCVYVIWLLHACCRRREFSRERIQNNKNDERFSTPSNTSLGTYHTLYSPFDTTVPCEHCCSLPFQRRHTFENLAVLLLCLLSPLYPCLLLLQQHPNR